MNEITKKCPMCAEEIPLASVTCEFCGTQFEVTSNGYCQNCHDVRDADGNGQCKVCGNTVVDLRVESKFIEEPAQKPIPASQSIAQTEIIKPGKSLLPIGILAGVLIFVIGAFLWLGRNGLPDVSSLVATITPTVAATFAPTSTLTPTVTPTRTSFPTATATPLPSWVTDFAEPILSAIANRPPTIQDDFHDNSGGWYSDFGRTDHLAPIKFINGELVLDECEAFRSKMGFMDFVLEIDGRFLPGTKGNPTWSIVFRAQGPADPQYAIGINYDGSLNISMHESSFYHEPLQVNRELQNNHILLIAKGSTFALYVNGQPLYHWQYTRINQAGYTYFRANAYNRGHPIIALDNLKIWDISNLP